jgi:hypothetical protein
MKIFIIGPEGAGKTVFLAMLSHHMAMASSEVVFEPANYDSANYVARTLELLDCQKWPNSNRQGEFRVFRWRLGRKGESPHEINLFDYSGQDMRSVLLEEDPEKLRDRSKELRKEIDDSDLLIYLLDMGGFIGSGGLTEANENGWLLQTFVKRQKWHSKRRILVVTKADVYAGMISEADGDLKKMIERHWPKVYNVDEFLRELKGIECFALTGVIVTTELDDDGNPVRKPRIPLQSDGFGPLVEGILSGIQRGRARRVVKHVGSAIGAVYRLCFKRPKVSLLLLGCLGCLGYFGWVLTTEPYGMVCALAMEGPI